MTRQAESKGVVIGTQQVVELARRVRAEVDGSTREMLDAIGAQQENAARRRIRRTKRTPSGKRWEAWSKGYAGTRERQHSLLVGNGRLADSLTHQVHLSELSVEVGSNLAYARIHLRGSTPGRKPRIPARPYLDTDGGFADPFDREELRDIVREFLSSRVSR